VSAAIFSRGGAVIDLLTWLTPAGGASLNKAGRRIERLYLQVNLQVRLGLQLYAPIALRELNITGSSTLSWWPS